MAKLYQFPAVSKADLASLESDIFAARNLLSDVEARLNGEFRDDVSVDHVATAIAAADEKTFGLIDRAECDRYRRFAEAAIIAAGGEPA